MWKTIKYDVRVHMNIFSVLDFTNNFFSKDVIFFCTVLFKFHFLYSLLLLWGHVRWTCYSYWWWSQVIIAIYERIITQQYISDMESPICTHSLSSRNWCPACVHVITKQPSSEEWHITVDPWFIVDACCVVNPYLIRLSMVFYSN
jgi:hypothetical protein